MSSGIGLSAGDSSAEHDEASHHHRAMFTLRPSDEREALARELCDRLTGLVGVVPELTFVRAVPAPAGGGADVFLHAVYPSTEAMTRVRAHPAHVSVIAWYQSIADDSRRVELEVPPLRDGAAQTKRTRQNPPNTTQ